MWEGKSLSMPINPCNIIPIKEARLPYQGLAEGNPGSATKQNRDMLKDYNTDTENDAKH
jgi:hypothetical protein